VCGIHVVWNEMVHFLCATLYSQRSTSWRPYTASVLRLCMKSVVSTSLVDCSRQSGCLVIVQISTVKPHILIIQHTGIPLLLLLLSVSDQQDYFSHSPKSAFLQVRRLLCRHFAVFLAPRLLASRAYSTDNWRLSVWCHQTFSNR